MELLRILNNSSIEGIPLLALKERLEKSQLISQTCIIIPYNDRMRNIKCIRDYYLDPLTKKKMKAAKMVNPCPAIHGTFGVDKCASLDCQTCHIKMVDMFYKREAFLINSYKK